MMGGAISTSRRRWPAPKWQTDLLAEREVLLRLLLFLLLLLEVMSSIERPFPSSKKLTSPSCFKLPSSSNKERRRVYAEKSGSQICCGPKEECGRG